VNVIADTQLDPRYAFLVRAAVRLWMVNRSEMTIDEAFDGLVVSLQCPCERETIERWQALDRLRPKRRRKK
jgi:hypothetical protein